jgi:hypothetical protein
MLCLSAVQSQYEPSPVTNCTKLIYAATGTCFDSGYAARGVNYAKKSFMKSTPVVNVIKLYSYVTDDKAQ